MLFESDAMLLHAVIAVLVFVELAASGRSGRHRAIDGDTFVTPSGERVRIQNFDAPELPQVGGERAQRALQRELDRGATFERIATDVYGRTVARVVDERDDDVGARLARSGYGEKHAGRRKR